MRSLSAPLICRRTSPRLGAATPRQPSYASRAALSAWSTSSRVAVLTSASVSPVAGLRDAWSSPEPHQPSCAL